MVKYCAMMFVTHPTCPINQVSIIVEVVLLKDQWLVKM